MLLKPLNLNVYFVCLAGGSPENHPEDVGRAGSGANREMRQSQLCVQRPGRSRPGCHSAGKGAAQSTHAAKGGGHRRGAVGERIILETIKNLRVIAHHIKCRMITVRL